jgi:hypothetical protein
MVVQAIFGEGQRSDGRGGREGSKGWRGRRLLASGAIGSRGKKEMEGGWRLGFGLSRERAWGSGGGGATWLGSVVGPDPDRRAAS